MAQNPLTAPPLRTPITEGAHDGVLPYDQRGKNKGNPGNGVLHQVWQRWNTQLYQTVNAPVQIADTPTVDTPGKVGQIITDGNNLYVFTAQGVWKQATLSAI